MSIRRDWLEREIKQGTDVILGVAGKTTPNDNFVVTATTSAGEDKPAAPTRSPRKSSRRKRKRQGK